MEVGSGAEDGLAWSSMGGRMSPYWKTERRRVGRVVMSSYLKPAGRGGREGREATLV